MSRDVFYLVPSESDGRNEQQQQATTSERVHDERTIETDASDGDTDRIDNIENTSEELIQPLLKERVYYAAKDGLPIALLGLLSNIENDTIRNAYINEVSLKILFFYLNFNENSELR